MYVCIWVYVHMYCIKNYTKKFQSTTSCTNVNLKIFLNLDTYKKSYASKPFSFCIF